MNEQPISQADSIRAAMEMIPVEERGVTYKNYLMIADRAKSMARTKFSTPTFLKGNEWDCLTVVELAVGWGFQPAMVAPLVYEVNGRMCFMSQLLHALLNKSNVLKDRMHFDFEGDGDERVVVCSGTFRGASKPSTLRTYPLGRISPKNSPLWKTDPDQQQCYLALSRWVKRFCPEIFLGCYTYEEMLDAPPDAHFGPDNAKDVTAAAKALHEKLQAAKAKADPLAVQEGFKDGAVVEAATSEIAQDDRKPAGAKKSRRGSDPTERKGKRSETPRSGKKALPKQDSVPETAPASLPHPESEQGVAQREKVHIPTNLHQYRTYAKTTVAGMTSLEQIMDWWNSRDQMSLRNKCGVTAEDKKAISDEYIIKQIRDLGGKV